MCLFLRVRFIKLLLRRSGEDPGVNKYMDNGNTMAAIRRGLKSEGYINDVTWKKLVYAYNISSV